MKYFVIIIIFVVSSCSTMFNNGSQSFQVRSSNSEKVKINVSTPDGTYDTATPATIVTSPSSFQNVVVKVIDECYEPTTLTVNKGITPSYWANIFNIYGFFIDPFAGTMWKYDLQTNIPVSKKQDSEDDCEQE